MASYASRRFVLTSLGTLSEKEFKPHSYDSGTKFSSTCFRIPAWSLRQLRPLSSDFPVDRNGLPVFFETKELSVLCMILLKTDISIFSICPQGQYRIPVRIADSEGMNCLDPQSQIATTPFCLALITTGYLHAS